MSDAMPFHERNQVLAEADELFAGADQRHRSAAPAPGFTQDFLTEAVQMFHSAALKYRDIGLGLRARQAFDRTAQCHRDLAALELHWARNAEADRDAIAVVWCEERQADGSCS